MQFLVIFIEIDKIMQNRILYIESTYYEMAIFLINIILAKLLKNMQLYTNLGLSYNVIIT